MSTIFKIMGRLEWERAEVEGVYRGSADDLRDRYMHFSTRAQVPGTLEKHFAGRDDLVLVEVETATLGEALRWGASRGGELFPHLYGELPVSAVVGVTPIA